MPDLCVPLSKIGAALRVDARDRRTKMENNPERFIEAPSPCPQALRRPVAGVTCWRSICVRIKLTSSTVRVSAGAKRAATTSPTRRQMALEGARRLLLYLRPGAVGDGGQLPMETVHVLPPFLENLFRANRRLGKIANESGRPHQALSEPGSRPTTRSSARCYSSSVLDEPARRRQTAGRLQLA